jgi:large subunit ribosomal protein L21
MVFEAVYAVVRTGGKQYRVEEGALLTVATLEGEPGKEIIFGDVLLLADGDTVKDAAKAKVTGEIVGHGKGEKIVVFRYKNKTRSRKRTGHRTKTTTVRITKIEA